METYERIRELRKNYLHMSQTDFGKQLGVSLSVINNIENNRLARPEQKTSLLKLICKEFSVNEEWLINGKPPMFIKPDTFSLDAFAKSHGATDLDIEIVKIYFELDPDSRKNLVEHFRKIFSKAPSVEAAQPTTEELEEAYKKRISNSVQNAESTALSTTEGTDILNRKEKALGT